MDDSLTCPHCGQASPPSNRFCGQCGNPLPRPEPPTTSQAARVVPPALRRTIAVLSADLANYTGASHHADPESMYMMVSRCLRALADCIHDTGGQVDRFLGDGLLAKFGAPEAHEDDPARAVRAALGMQRAMESLRPEFHSVSPWEMHLRIGVDAGEVIAGPLGGPRSVDSGIFGHTVNLASRLQTAARLDTVLVSEAVFRLTRAAFEFSEPIPLQLRGINEPVTAYEVFATRSRPLRSRGLSGRHSPMIGRDAEAQALVSRIHRLAAGTRGGIVTVFGEAGFGKTRLVEEALQAVPASALVLRSEASLHSKTAYGLLGQLLDQYYAIGPGDPPGVRRTKFDQSGKGTPSAPDLRRAIAEILRLPHVGTERAESRRMTDAKASKEAIIASVRRLLSWRCRSQPMVVVCEDVHWADRSSLEVLGNLIDLVEEIPLALIVTARHEARSELTAVSADRRPASPDAWLELSLKELSPSECETLLDHLLSEARLPPRLRRTIAERSAGNPFLLEEIVRMLLDKGVIRQAGETWIAEPGWEAAVQRVPETVGGLILNRYDQLPEALQRVLQVASVLGRWFDVDLLAAVASLDSQSVASHLGTLEAMDFVRRSAGRDRDRYAYRHALTQQAIYDMLLHSVRAEYHRRAAQALERLHEFRLDEGGDPAMLAYHYAQSDPERAVPLLLAAGHGAKARFANDEALRFFEQAERLLPESPVATPLRAQISSAMGEVLSQMGRNAEADRRYRTALEFSTGDASAEGLIRFRLGQLANGRGDFQAGLEHLATAEFLIAGQGDTAQEFSPAEVALERGWAHLCLGHMDSALEHTRAAVEQAEAACDRSALAGALNVLGGALYRQGRLVEAAGTVERALSLHEELGHIRECAITQSNLSILDIERGEWRRAESLLRQSLFVLKEIGDLSAEGRLWNTLGVLLMKQGRFTDALYSTDRALAIARQQSYERGIIARLVNRGQVWLRSDQPQRVLADLEEALRIIERTGEAFFRLDARALCAEAHLQMGNRPTAQEMIQACLEATPEDETGEVAANVHRVAGEVSAALGDVRAAQARFEKSLALYRAGGNAYEQACVESRLGELICAGAERDRQRLEAGLSHMAEALNVLRALGARHDARLAEARMKRVPALPALAPTDGAGRRSRLAIVVFALLGASESEAWGGAGEAAHARRDQTASALSQVAEESGGSAVQAEGGTALVYDSKAVLSALRGALAVLDAVAHLNRPSAGTGESIPVRIGVAAGNVPGFGGTPAEVELVANVAQVGRRASALARMAEPGSILVTSTVQGMASTQFVFEHVADDPEPRVPEGVFRLRRARPASGPKLALPSSARLVGRRAELARLAAFGERAAQGARGEVCYLEGEAGTGKTRMIEELVQRLDQRVTVLHGKCESYRGRMSYWPFLDMLHTPAGLRLDESGELRMLFRVQPPDRERQDLVHGLPAEQSRAELFARMRGALLQQVAHAPILLILDDVHWVDLASLDLLEFLVPLTAAHPVNLLLVGRAELPGPHRALLGLAERACRDRFTHISLSDLSSDDGAALVCDLLGTDDLPSSLSWVREASGATPLLLEETVRLMMEQGWLTPAADATETFRAPLVPETFREVMLTRLDLLEQETQHLVQVAAVIGETFDKSILRWVAGMEDVAERLAELIERGIVLPADPAAPLAHRFKHTLTRETVYSTLLASKRALLHQRVGEALEALFPDRADEMAELLAYHYENSNVLDKAIDYLVLAGQKSLTRFARDEALAYFRRGRDLLRQTASPSLRQRLPVGMGLADALAASGSHREAVAQLRDLMTLAEAEGISPLQQASVHIRLGHSLRALGEFADAESAFARARSLMTGSAELEPMEAAARAAPEWARERVRCEYGRAQVLMETRRLGESQTVADWALALAHRAGLSADVADLCGVKGALAFRRGDLTAAMEAVQTGLRLRSDLGDRAGMAAAHSNLGMLATSMLEWESAEAHFRTGLAIRRDIGDVPGILIGCNNLGQLLKDEGRLPEALALLEDAADLGGMVDSPPHLARCLINLGEARALAGRHDQTGVAFDRGLALADWVNSLPLVAEGLWKRADAAAAAGLFEDAAAFALRALDAAHQTHSRMQQAEAHRTLARAERGRGDASAALRQAEQFDALLSPIGDPFTRARFHLERGLTLIAAGQCVEAQAALERAVEVFRRVKARRYLIEAESALARLRPTAAHLEGD